MNTITQYERDMIDYLSHKIDNNTAILEEYNHYEQLLLKAGLTQEQIRAKMTANGIRSYNQYLDERKSATTREQKNVVEVIIVAGLVVLSAIIGLLVITGKLIISDDRKQF